MPWHTAIRARPLRTLVRFAFILKVFTGGDADAEVAESSCSGP